jgi:hypothetical protein
MNFFLVILLVGLLVGTFYALNLKRPQLMLTLSTSWVGSELLFLGASLVFFDFGTVVEFIFNLRNGEFNRVSALFIVLFLLFILCFMSGVYFQVKNYLKETDLRRSYIVSRGSDLYKSLNHGGDDNN